MRVLIDIKESESIGLGHLAETQGRSRKNYIEFILKQHLNEALKTIPKAVKNEMLEADKNQ